jgi:predicted ATP-binding protein involved in virulence
MIRNPYKYKGALDPVNDQLVCIPRTFDLNRIITGIENGQYWNILGSRQVGKSTFLRQIQNHFSNAYCLCFTFDVSPKKIKIFYQWLMDKIREGIPSKKNGMKINKNLEPKHLFLDFLEKFQPREDKKIILLFDEIEGIPFLKDFLDIWRSIYESRYNKKQLERYAIITAGSTDLVELTTGTTSPYNVAEDLYLRDFSQQESQTLIQAPFKQLEIKIEKKAKQKLISQISGHPQMLQHACSNLVEIAFREKRDIQEKDIDTTIEILLKNNTSISILKHDIAKNQKLGGLIKDIFKGLKKTYHPYKEFSFSGAGCIVEDKNSFCAIRNEVYKRLLRDVIGKDFDIFLIKEKSRDLYFDKENETPLPYALKQIQIKDYYGIEETGISNLPLDTQWIFLTGDNSFGKTAVLRALTIGLLGERDEGTLLTWEQENCKVSVEIQTKTGTQENNLRDPDFKSFKNFVAYGPSRLEVQSPETQDKIKEKNSRTYSIFNTDGILLNIEHEMLRWHQRSNDESLKEKEKKEYKTKFDVAKKTFLLLLPHIADIKVIKIKEKGEKEKKEKVVYTEKEGGEYGKPYEQLPLEKLASGHKSIIAMVGDIMIRLYQQQPDVKKTQDLGGIVIIDELDLHLHPKWQRVLPSELSKVFPKVQFIVSTHSVFPILGAKKKSVFLKVNRNVEKGIQIQKLDIDIKNLLPNSILTSPIFDLEGKHIVPEMNESIYETRTESTFDEIIDRDKIRERLRTLKAIDLDIPDDLFKTG